MRNTPRITYMENGLAHDVLHNTLIRVLISF
jgi:hypothetical protein